MTKNDVIIQLRQKDTRFLLKYDNRIYAYVQENITNPDYHNKYELLSVLRFIEFFGKYKFRYSEVKKFIVYYESLEFAGLKGPERYKLTSVQLFQIANIFGFWDGDSRVCRNALLFVPRKFSKTTFVAAVAVYDLLFGDFNGQCYTAANSYEQATVCFDMVKFILKRLDPRTKSFKIVKEAAYNKRKGKNSKIKCVSNSPDKLDGLNCSLTIVDEYSQADDSGMFDVLTTSMGARKNPLTIVITTASDKHDTPFTVMLNHYKRILDGDFSNDRIFAHLFMPDEDDADYGSPSLWRKVHPHLGITVFEEFYHDEWAKAQSSAVYMSAFLTKLLNVFCSAGKSWVDQDAIKAVSEPVNLEDYRGCKAMVSVDLSISDDFSAVCYEIYDEKNGKFIAKVDYYIPRGTMERHANSSFYRKMASDGYLNIIEGDTIDYKRIAQDIGEKAKILKTLQIGYDPYKSIDFTNMTSAMWGSKTLVPIKQTIASFTAPTEIVEKLIYDKKFILDDNPLNAYCFGNVQIMEDSIGNRKPMKKGENEKIDGVITIIQCAYLFANYQHK